MAFEHSAGRSIISRSLEPFAAGLWILFWIWTLFTGALWISGIGEAEVSEWSRNEGLRAALVKIVGLADAIWCVLAAANVHYGIAITRGLPTARLWSGAVMVLVLFIAATSALTSFPLGPIHFTTRLGLKFGPVPFGIPLLWLCLILGARETTLWLFPRATQFAVGAGAGVLVLLSDLVLEPVAWRVRALWIWYPHHGVIPPFPPPQNCAVWAAVSFAFAYFLREKEVSTSHSPLPRPMLVFCALNTVFLAVLLVRVV